MTLADKMKVVQINITCGSGSTGQICVAVSRMLTQRNIENYILYGHGTSDYPLGYCCQKPYEIKLNVLKTRLFGDWGFEANAATKRILRHLEQIDPDVIHLHNLHGHNVNLGMLFRYIRKKNIRVFWTFHDCWAYTGYCPHYDMIGCERWKHGCGKCPVYRRYSWFFDRSAAMFRRKKKLFSGLDITVITPSEWLAKEVVKSFFKEYPFKVINNGVDLSVFTPTPSDFRERYALTDKKLILGVAYDWSVKKGLDVLERSARELPDDYRVILVGVNAETEKRLPKNIIAIRRTSDQKELAAIYTAADVYANPTREEVLGLTNIEALACGTPVVTFDVGGSPESIDETCGISVPKDDFEGFVQAVRTVCDRKPFSRDDCRRRAEKYDKDEKFLQYIELYTDGT